MTTDHLDDDTRPPLHTIKARRIHPDTWVPAGIEALPAGMLNVRIWDADSYTTEPCPGIVHLESAVTEVVLVGADPDGELFDNETGELWDDDPAVVGTEPADPPHRTKHYADPQWRPAYVGGGYLGTCSTDQVRQLLTKHGFPNAIPHEAAER